MAGHIARVAARLFAERGYDATSVREIVEAAGVTKPTLYYHFRSKEGLAQALLTVPMNRLIGSLEAILAASLPPGEKLEQMLEAHFSFCREDPDRARFMYALFFGPLGKGLLAELARFGAILAALLAQGVEQAAAAGQIDLERAPACTAALRGLIVIHTMDFLYRGDALGPGLARRIVADLLRGFRPPARPGRLARTGGRRRASKAV